MTIYSDDSAVFRCESCRKYFNYSQMTFNRVCFECYDQYYFGTYLSDDELLSYDADVTNYFSALQPELATTKNPLMGIEIELERDVSYEIDEDGYEYPISSCNVVAPAVQTNGFGIIVHDGSLRAGFEIVSRPMPHSVLVSEIDKLFNTPDFLRGVTCSERCGVHIHIDKSRFSVNHLNKFLLFFGNEENWNFLIGVAGRDFTNNRYTMSEAPGMKFKPKRGDVGRNKNLKWVARYGRTKYQPVRIKNHTVEVRIFSGTTDVERLKKYLTILHNIFLFTKSADYETLTVEEFWRWVMKPKVPKKRKKSVNLNTE